MSFKGTILICLLFLLLAGNSMAADPEEEGVRLDFTFVISEDSVVQKSQTLEKVKSAFADTDGDGIYDQVTFDGQVVDAKVDVEDAQGFSFADGSKMVFYPTRLRRLPASGTYAVIGFLHQWNEAESRVVAVLVHQDKNYETSDGISVYVINRAGVRIGALFYAFMEKSFLRYTAPYQRWMQTGHDFAVGTSPTVSNYFLMGKDLGLVDTVLVINLSLSAAPAPPGQDFDLRKPEPNVVKESLRHPDMWNVFSGSTAGGIFTTVKVGDETVTGTIMPEKAQGLNMGAGRHIVFYPAALNSLPTPPARGTNWELMGFLHYFDSEGKLNTMLSVLIGQIAGDPTSLGTRVLFVDNTGMAAGQPKYSFFPRRSVKLMSSYSLWQDSGNDFTLGYREGTGSRFYITKEIGLIDKIFVIGYQLY